MNHANGGGIVTVKKHVNHDQIQVIVATINPFNDIRISNYCLYNLLLPIILPFCPIGRSEFP